MNETVRTTPVFDRIWNFFASVRLSVVVLVLLALTSVVGTIIPQNKSALYYHQNYSELTIRIFDFFHLFDMYHSWWFRFLILVLAMNITICSLERLPRTLDIVRKKPKWNLNRFKTAKAAHIFAVEGPADNHRDNFSSIVKKSFGAPVLEENSNGFVIFSERGRYSRLGVYIVHVSVLFLISGSLLGSLFGFEAFVNIPEGTTVEDVTLRNSKEKQPLGFEVRCDRFELTTYDNGAPKEYRSDLTIIENGEEVLKKNIIVNKPLQYKGIRFYQSSYGTVPGKNIVLAFTSSKSGMVYEKNVTIDEPVDLEENLGTFVLKGFMHSLPFMGHDLGESYVGFIDNGSKEPEKIILPIQFQKFDKMRKGDVSVELVKYDSSYYTGLQVNKDPGVALVYIGFTLMIIGCYIAFFMTHQSLCVEVNETDKDGCEVRVSGTANRNRLGMDTVIKKIVFRLENA